MAVRGGRRIRVSSFVNKDKDILIHADFLDKELSNCDKNGCHYWIPLYRQKIPQRPIQAIRTFLFWLIDNNYIDLLDPAKVSFGYWSHDMNLSKEKRLKMEAKVFKNS